MATPVKCEELRAQLSERDITREDLVGKSVRKYGLPRPTMSWKPAEPRKQKTVCMNMTFEIHYLMTAKQNLESVHEYDL